MVNSSECVKCGTSKGGKRSCCARGGAWFKNCGDVGDMKFDHTWAEGIQSCESFAARVTVKMPLQIIARNVQIIVYPRDTTETHDTTVQHTIISRADSMFDVGIIGSRDCVGLARATLCICVVLIVLYLQR